MKGRKDGRDTADNSVFAVRYAHPNVFGTSQTRQPLYEISKEGVAINDRITGTSRTI